MKLTKDTLEGNIDISKLVKDKAIDISDVDKLDTFGAIFVLGLLETHKDKELVGKKEHIEFIQHVKNLMSYEKKSDKKDKHFKISLSFLEYIGGLVYQAFRSIKDMEFGSFLKEIENSGIGSLFILGVLSFLVGIVIAYQSANELISFGANIFIVNLIGISAFRELGPLITGIILAGRVGSGYTANIGIRNVYEELDAIEVMGISPFVVFGIPRILILTLITPILVLFSSNLMVLGGAIIANTYLDIPFNMFFERLRETVGFTQLFVGLIKAPFFGAYIGLIGTYFGFYAGKKPEDVTLNVMKSVVMSISGIIVIDALFSIIFAKIGI